MRSPKLSYLHYLLSYSLSGNSILEIAGLESWLLLLRHDCCCTCSRIEQEMQHVFCTYSYAMFSSASFMHAKTERVAAV